MYSTVRHRRYRHFAASIFLAATLTLLTTGAAAAADDLWPLVSIADVAVWGTLTESDAVANERLHTIAVSAVADGRGSRGPAFIRLLERGGGHPDACWLAPGATGLFLYKTAAALADDTSGADGCLVSGGFSATDGSHELRAIIAEIFQSRAAGREPGHERFIALLASPDRDCRSLALGWLRRTSQTFAMEDAAAIERACAVENDEANQQALLELCLLHRFSFAEELAAALLFGAGAADAVETALIYLTEHASLRIKAELLLAFDTSDHERKTHLLEAYARLELQESQHLWEEALASADAGLREAALLGIGKARLPRAAEIYKEVLASDDPAIRCAALRGIAGLDGADARKLLSNYIAGAPRGDRAVDLARKILKHPYRHGRTNCEREARKSGRRD